MPSFKPYKHGIGFEVAISPKGVRRWKPIQWLTPYLYGSDVEFVVTPHPKQHCDLDYEWVLWRWDGANKHHVNKGKGRLRQENSSKEIYVGYLSLTGHYILDMRWGTDIENNKDYQLMVNFTVMDRDIHRMNLAFTLSSGTIGAILGALIAIALRG